MRTRRLSIGVFPVETQKLALTFGKVHDYSLQSDMTISKLSAKEWLNDEVNTGVEHHRRTGHWRDEDRRGSGGEPQPRGHHEAVAAQRHRRDAWRAVEDWRRRWHGEVGDLIGSSFFVGMTSKPDDLSDFAAGKTIANFTVKGTMSDSVVAAAKINVVSVAAVDANPGAKSAVFYADAIKSLRSQRRGEENESRCGGHSPTRCCRIIRCRCFKPAA
jgi:hypothetical protein